MNELFQRISIAVGVTAMLFGVVFSFIWKETDKIGPLFFMGSLLVF
jgi:hypothetical protein